jgi:hypothetical protein
VKKAPTAAPSASKASKTGKPPAGGTTGKALAKPVPAAAGKAAPAKPTAKTATKDRPSQKNESPTPPSKFARFEDRDAAGKVIRCQAAVRGHLARKSVAKERAFRDAMKVRHPSRFFFF